MTLRRAGLALLFPLMSAQSIAESGVWTALGPPGGCVELPVVHPRDPSTLFIRDASGIVRSADGGLTWQRTDFPPIEHPVIHPTQTDVMFGIEARRVDLWPNTFRDLVIWRSEDGGASWGRQGVIQQFEWRDDTPIVALDPVIPDVAYLAGCSAVWRTTDGGAAWQPVLQWGECASPAIAVDPRAPLRIYAVHGPDLYRSTDGGTSWSVSRPDLGIFYDAMRDFFGAVRLFVGGDILGTLYASSSGGVYRSVDRGLLWTRLPTPGASFSLVAMAPSDGRTLYGEAPGVGIARSTDAGETWQITGSTPQGSCGSAFRVDPLDASVLWATSRSGRVLRTPDAGRHWEIRGGALDGFVTVRTVAADQGNPCRLYASVDGMGLVRSDDRGASWFVVASDVNADQLVIVPGAYPTIYAGMPSSIVASNDAGVTWHLVLEAGNLAVDPAQPTTLFAAVYSIGGGYVNVQRSTDGGRTWQFVVSLPQLNTLAIDAADHDTAIAATDYGVFLSRDGGSTWHPGRYQIRAVSAIATDPYAPGVYLATSRSSLMRSTDGGERWDVVSGFLGVVGSPPAIDDLLFDPSTPGVAFASTDLGVFRSEDHGVTWRRYGSGLAYAVVQKLALSGDSRTLYCATSNAGAFALDLGARPCPPTRPRRHLRPASDRPGGPSSDRPAPAGAP